MDVQKNADFSSLKGMTVLLAEDDEINRIVVSKMLELRNINVICASDGYQAVDVFSKMEDISLVLMDIQLPGKDGVQTTREIRAIQEKRGVKVPIIALTAYVMDGNRDYFISMGLDDYVAKPVEIAVLMDTIQKHISIYRD